MIQNEINASPQIHKVFIPADLSVIIVMLEHFFSEVSIKYSELLNAVNSLTTCTVTKEIVSVSKWVGE